MAEVITSVRNARIKAAAALAQKKHRNDRRQFLVEGPNAVEMALVAGVVETIYAVPSLTEDYAGGPVEVATVEPHVLERLADTSSPQGVVAVANIPHASLDEVVRGAGFAIVLEGANDPGNVGAIVRTADAAGAEGVVLLAGSADPYNPKAVRASAGSIVNIPVVTDTTLPALVERAEAVGQPIVGLAADGDQTLERSGLLDPPVALLFGSEAHGLSPDALEAVAATLAIPIFGRAESLNLAAAAAVVSYAAAMRLHGSSS